MCIFVAFIVVNRRLLFFSRLLFRPARDLFQVTVLTEMKGLWSLVLCHLQVWIEGWNSLCYFCICCLGSLGGTRCELDIWKICRVYVHPRTHYYPEEIERMWSTLCCSVHPTIVSLITSSKFINKDAVVGPKWLFGLFMHCWGILIPASSDNLETNSKHVALFCFSLWKVFSVMSIPTQCINANLIRQL